jgi:hypothetical protein
VRSLVVLLVLVTACGDDDPSGGPDAGVDAEAPDANLMPETLADTGLCADPSCTQLAAGVREFAPEYHLWSDGATKRRWIALPPQATIDSSDMDYWAFPVGTKLWKEFTRGTTRVETRFLHKVGPGDNDWYMVAYAWNAAQDEAIATPLGDDDVLGTDHDIPSRSDCRKCHDRLPSRVLGFQAILLDHGGPGLTLGELVELGWLSHPPSTDGVDYYPVPGTDTARAALGYLHVNCGNCHNPRSDVLNSVPVVWRLDVASLGAVETTPAYTTAVGVAPTLTNVPAATAILEPGSPGTSSAYLRLESVQAATMMPPIGREVVDDTGAAALRAWIVELAGN